MQAEELRSLNVTELAGKVRQWKDELFRLSIKRMHSEVKDTSQLSKLRKNIARALTILKQKEKVEDGK